MDVSSLEALKINCLKNNIIISDDNIKIFDLYGEFLKDYNKKVNLTAITQDDEIVEKHFLDSVIINRFIDIDGKKIIDVGSGAGFPGVPLKIINNNIDITLVDSVGKKIKFLELLKDYLNIFYYIINCRAEDLGKNHQYREKYDIVVARAVKNLRVLSEYCLPLLSIQGYFLAMKGSKNIDQEVNDAKDIIKLLGGEIIDLFKYELPSKDKRSIILIKKISQTPSKYPRMSAKILRK